MENIENIENIENKKKYKYDDKKHFKKFLESHKDKLNESIKCPICDGSYTYFNKSRHIHSTRHLKYKKLYDELQTIEDEKDKIIFKLRNKMKE